MRSNVWGSGYLSRRGGQRSNASPAQLAGDVLCLCKKVDLVVEHGRRALRAKGAAVDGCGRGRLGAMPIVITGVVLDGIGFDSNTDDDGICGSGAERYKIFGARQATGDGFGDALGGDEVRLGDMVSLFDIGDGRLRCRLARKGIGAVSAGRIELIEVATCEDD